MSAVTVNNVYVVCSYGQPFTGAPRSIRFQIKADSYDTNTGKAIALIYQKIIGLISQRWGDYIDSPKKYLEIHETTTDNLNLLSSKFDKIKVLTLVMVTQYDFFKTTFDYIGRRCQGNYVDYNDVLTAIKDAPDVQK